MDRRLCSTTARTRLIGNPVTALQTDAVKRAAGRFDLNVAIVEIRRAEDIAPAIEALKGLADALIVPSEPSTTPIEFRSS
jgi:ABC-type uncharacterized transport system substrate-binding protein